MSPYDSISVRYSVTLIYAVFSLKDLDFVQQASHTTIVSLSLQCGLEHSSVSRLLLSSLSIHVHLYCLKGVNSCQRIFMDLKIISCEVECKCTVIHSVYIKIPGIFTFATLI